MIVRSYSRTVGGVIDTLIVVKFLVDKNLNMEFALVLIQSVVLNPLQSM